MTESGNTIVWFLILPISFAPLMLVASNPTVLGRKYKSNPKVRIFVVCLCCASEHNRYSYCSLKLTINYLLKPKLLGWNLIQDLNPHRWLALETKGLAAYIFLGLNPQAEVKNGFPKGEASQTKEIIALNEGAIKMPNGGNKIPTVCFMSLKTTPDTNQDASSEVSAGLWPKLMTTTQEQDNQVTNLGILTNERAPSQSAILPLLNLGVLATRPHISQYLDEPLMENINERPSGPSALLPAYFCLTGVLFGPVHFTEYPLKPEYTDYIPKKVLELYSLAHKKHQLDTTNKVPLT
ncbi:hypothetical protein DSO57_1026658 [Entomophthora muscae]|uniref:Uncharacterized protein n=1 Tax=Entomophthora muscae TaxID=34485 RepID=A0ACC2S3Y1_9FUNG|nr:hypothetical protein DSO57_1026658 [Entomophthora muscae]